MSSSEQVLIISVWSIPPTLVAEVQSRHPHCNIMSFKVSSWDDFSTVPTAAWAPATVIMAYNLPWQIPLRSPNLKYVQLVSAASDHMRNHPVYTQSNITICSANGIHGFVPPLPPRLFDLTHSGFRDRVIPIKWLVESNG
jgi:hypothetical protein